MKKILALLCCLLMLPVGALADSLDGQPLHELAARYGFRFGGAMSYGQQYQKSYTALARHFNTITPTNEMKAYSLLDAYASRAAEDGMPVMNYTRADEMMAWAQEQGMHVRGHVLVWDAYMCDWFFREGYDVSKPYADRETMRARLRYYITEVMTHFEEKFPGLVDCWDVVNEAVGDSAGEYEPKDKRHVRTMRNGAENPFYTCVGEDYVEYAFLCARDAADALGADIKLYYNDYNAIQLPKCKAICELVESINRYAQDDQGGYRKLIDGVGMQGYIGGYGTQSGCLNMTDLNRIKTAVKNYAKAGAEVQFTEMAVRNYDKDKIEEHGAFYGEVAKLLTTLNEEGTVFTGWTIWGLVDCPQLPQDHYTWRLNSPYGGLVDQQGQPKPAFHAVYEALGGR